jgi:hypothetical protein
VDAEMTYTELKEKMKEFHLGNISKMELACAVHLWQRAEGFNPVEIGEVKLSWHQNTKK